MRGIQGYIFVPVDPTQLDPRRTKRGPQSDVEVHRLREQRAAHPAPRDPEAVDLIAEFAGQSVPVRVITPTEPPRGAILSLHGGGFYFGAAAYDDMWNRELADALGVAVIGVDYRLAPETPWPAAPDDCEVAAQWLIDHAPEKFGTDRLALMGFSAGSTLAMTTLLRLRDAGLAHRFCGAALQFGTYDLSATTRAGRLIADEYFLGAYLGHVDDRTPPDISPIFGDLHDLPPALLVVGSDDILVDDNRAMATRLADAGNEVELRVYPASPHGFTHHSTSTAAVARSDVAGWLSTRLTG